MRSISGGGRSARMERDPHPTHSLSLMCRPPHKGEVKGAQFESLSSSLSEFCGAPGGGGGGGGAVGLWPNSQSKKP